MKKVLLTACVALLLAGAARAQAPTVNFAQVGYSTLTTGTTGGAGGTAVTVSTGSALQAAINGNRSNAPLTIYISGTITPANSPGLSKIDVKDRNNISIIGVGTSGEFHGIGIKIWRARNIIVQNLNIHHVNTGDKDCISIEGPSDHIWIDHCELHNQFQGIDQDYYDGLLDAKNNCEYITYSWNYLHDAWKASLCGFEDTDNYDRKITYHHNRFENINSRLPLFRFGNGHVFNNYYSGVVSTAANSRMGACLKIENNAFVNTRNPYVSAYSTQDGFGDIVGNQLVNSPFAYSADTRVLRACAAVIPYSYAQVLNNAADVAAVVIPNAGVGHLGTVTGTARPRESQNFRAYPNPSQGVTSFDFVLPKGGSISIGLYNMAGVKVAEVLNEPALSAGLHSTTYTNPSLAAGLYFCVVKTEQGVYTHKLVLE
ncbi:hypothetical protein GCM10023185_13680 [Hymenobacter saemangeumensis]|uniref:Pectate lyase domain-containing protein n=1 Tax=Hymenobacter saemangeumensis TaxID=1084522 RepID=A0ABP8I7W6_9BACT